MENESKFQNPLPQKSISSKKLNSVNERALAKTSIVNKRAKTKASGKYLCIKFVKMRVIDSNILIPLPFTVVKSSIYGQKEIRDIAS